MYNKKSVMFQIDFRKVTVGMHYFSFSNFRTGYTENKDSPKGIVFHTAGIFPTSIVAHFDAKEWL